MKFKDLEELGVFKVVFKDGTEDVYRINDGNLEVICDDEWVIDEEVSFNSFLHAESIEPVWSPKIGELVYFINFSRKFGVDMCIYTGENKKIIDTLFPLGLVFKEDYDACKKLMEIAKVCSNNLYGDELNG